MSDEHKSKRELIIEVVALRKQVNDLKEAALARRRVEDAVRAAEALCRRALDEAPVGLVVLDAEGELLLVNAWLLRHLGFASRQELHVAGGIGDWRRVLEEIRGRPGIAVPAVLRRADGTAAHLRLRAGRNSGPDAVTIVVEPELRELSVARAPEGDAVGGADPG
jgi:PAS domain-containing protein